MMISNEQHLSTEISKVVPKMSIEPSNTVNNYERRNQEELLLQEKLAISEPFTLDKDKYKDTIVKNAARDYYETEVNNKGGNINIRYYCPTICCSQGW